MAYRILYNIFIKHTYFVNEKCNCVQLSPDIATLKIMRGYQWVFKQVDTNHWIIAGDPTTETVASAAIENIKLNISVSDSGFLYYTRYTEHSMNEGADIGFGIPQKSDSLIRVPQDVQHVIRKDNSSVYGTILFTVTAESLKHTADSPINLSVCFEAPALFWEYKVIPRRPDGTCNIFLSEDKNLISFTNAVSCKIDEIDACSIRSTEPVKLCQHYPYVIRLYEIKTYGKKLVCNNVPTPVPGRFLSAEKDCVQHYLYF